MYTRVESSFWQDEKMRAVSGDARHLMLYCLTSPHRNILGFYFLPAPYACFDLGWDEKRFTAALTELLNNKRIKYDFDKHVILVVNYLKHNPLGNPNQTTSAIKKLEELPDTKLLHDFAIILEQFTEPFIEPLKEQLQQRLQAFPNPSETLSKGLDNPSETLLKQGTGTGTGTGTVLSTPPPPSPTPNGAGEGGGGEKESSPPKTITDLIDEATRYTAEQRAIIRDYWDTVRFTRRRGAVAPSIVKTELEYWERFPPDIVLEALNIHLTKYRNKREEYTRGIMRRLQEERRNGGDFNHTAQNRENHGRPGNRARTRTARTSACDYIGGKYGAIFEKERQAVHSTTSGSLDSE